MTYSAVGYVLGISSRYLPGAKPVVHICGHVARQSRGGPFTALINLIEKYGRVHGAAFPRSMSRER